MDFELTEADLTAWAEPASTAGQLHGPLRGLAALKEATPQDLSFLANPKYSAQAATSLAGALLLPEDYTGPEPRPGQLHLYCARPSLALARICARLEQREAPPRPAGIHPSATVDAAARVSPTAWIGPGCVIEAGADIGEDCRLHARVYVGPGCCVGDHCELFAGVCLYPGTRLGRRVRLHAGVVAGSDGFGYETVDGVHEKVPQIGRLEIGDDVEVGANSTLDRARFGVTRIGAGTKIDNLVQVAHNVETGTGCIICAQAGISGSSTLGDYVILAGQAGVAGHVHLADQTVAGAQSGIRADTQPGQYLRGTPALDAALANRADVLHKKLPELHRRLKALEQRLPPA